MLVAADWARSRQGSGTGYYPLGLPELRARIAEYYSSRGLPTEADNIVVVPGALAAVSVVARTFLGPGDRVVVESPGYPNAVGATVAAGARPVPLGIGAGHWDVDEIAATVRRCAPTLVMITPWCLMPEPIAPLVAAAGRPPRRCTPARC